MALVIELGFQLAGIAPTEIVSSDAVPEHGLGRAVADLPGARVLEIDEDVAVGTRNHGRHDQYGGSSVLHPGIPAGARGHQVSAVPSRDIGRGHLHEGQALGDGDAGSRLMARKAPDAGAEGDPAPEIVPSEPSETSVSAIQIE